MHTGQIKIQDILACSFLDDLLELRDEELPKDQQQNNWFSAPSALRVYGVYLNLDKDHNGMLSKEELSRYGMGTLTPVFIDRVFQECLTYDDPVFVLRGANAPVTCVTFLEYTGPGKIQRIAAGTQEGQVFIWDLKTSSIVCKWSGHPGSSIVWIHSLVPGKLWTQGRHDNIKLWDITALPPEAESQYPLVDYLGFRCQESRKSYAGGLVEH
ncbi:Serine/threonine-protein phosphatase 2A regulatory subunit B'' subunit gamma [Penaeus vannamei]|uniref:Serine/threonine-protein phosphatase 2A regulatory subunit B'' subunit gamma n=1 Tax=Penaeus vannamei TaxID=6689 RepID=A0A423TG72_PENVA|nr:Serine/threonine-protein phosphatase 2A regulatory subunit B'' subunit gamma [Penaeus vannamei]